MRIALTCTLSDVITVAERTLHQTAAPLVTTWFGLSHSLVIVPTSERNVGDNEAGSLLSALAVAALNARW